MSGAGLALLQQATSALREKEECGDVEEEEAAVLEALASFEGTSSSPLGPGNVTAVVSARCELGAAAFNAKRFPEARRHLEAALEDCKRFESNGSMIGEEEAMLEELHSRVLFFLAQTCQANEEKESAAVYCGQTLARQLKGAMKKKNEKNIDEAPGFTADEWVKNCTELAGYFQSQGDLVTAEHCASAAENVADSFDTCADVKIRVEWCWGTLISGCLRGRFAKKCGTKDETRAPPAITFDAITDELEPTTLSQGPRDIEEARSLFNRGMRCFNRVIAFYNIDGDVTDHCYCLVDRNALYMGLAHWEEDVHRQCVLQRMRAKLAEPVLETLNQKAFPGVCMSLHNAKVEAGRPRKKVTAVGEKARLHFEKLLSFFFSDPDTKMMPNRVDNNEDLFLSAKFAIAKVYYKLHSLYDSPEERQGMLRKAQIEYESYVEYIRRNQLQADHESEMDICEQMSELLAKKAARSGTQS